MPVLVEHYAILLRAPLRHLQLGDYLPEQPREVAEGLQQDEAILQGELVLTNILRLETVEKGHLLPTYHGQSLPLYLIILDVPPRSHLHQVDRRSLFVLGDLVGWFGKQVLLFLVAPFVAFEANEAINQIVAYFLVEGGFFLQQGFGSLQLLMVDKGFLSAAVLIDDELADGVFVAVVQSQIIGSQFALLYDAEVDSSQLQQKRKDAVCPVDDGNHEQGKALSGLAVDCYAVSLFVVLVYFFEQDSQAVDCVELGADVEDVPLGAFGAGLLVPGDDLPVEKLEQIPGFVVADEGVDLVFEVLGDELGGGEVSDGEGQLAVEFVQAVELFVDVHVCLGLIREIHGFIWNRNINRVFY